MILDISASKFRRVFEQKRFHLPMRWDGKDFLSTVDSLYTSYRRALRRAVGENCQLADVLCEGIRRSIECYFEGSPSRAFSEFDEVMNTLMGYPLRTYQKSARGDSLGYIDPLKLFRVRNVQQNTLYRRTDIFHTPYNLRSKVATCRYSIAGYPSLYLGTSLALCGEESKAGSLTDFQIASRFELVRDRNQNPTQINVIELAVKPQDFLPKNEDRDHIYENRSGRRFDELDLNKNDIRVAYLLWYPLIAACSFIRVSKADPFAAEYIIPQLLMQWVRHRFQQEELYGIRYFSCASVKASEMGFNYVFPVSGKHYKKTQFCGVLAKSFRLTVPKYLHEYPSLEACERALINDTDINYI